MLKSFVCFVFAFLCFSTSVSAQSVETPWLQQAGVVCGGGLNIEVRGDLEAALSKRLRLANVDSGGTFKQSDVTALLNQFGESTKEPVYRQYVECVLTLMSVANSTSTLPPREITLQAPISVAPLEALKRGDRVALAPNDVVAVRNHNLIFTVNSIGQQDRPFVYFTWSNSETGALESNRYVYQGDLIKMGENCTIVPYKIDQENGQVSILSNC